MIVEFFSAVIVSYNIEFSAVSCSNVRRVTCPSLTGIETLVNGLWNFFMVDQFVHPVVK